MNLAEALADLGTRFPGESGARQPVHTVYGGAQLFKSDTTVKLGQLALRALNEFAPDPFVFARAIGLTGAETLPPTVGESRALHEVLTLDAPAARRTNPPAWRLHRTRGFVIWFAGRCVASSPATAIQ